MQWLFIVWDKRFETGIPILDEQYRGLISIINAFFFHRQDVEKDMELILLPTAKMFFNYVKVYCQTVEKLMRNTGYPDLGKYQILHQEMLEHITYMTGEFLKQRDANGFLNFLKEYFLSAVEHQEKEYLPYLREYFQQCR